MNRMHPAPRPARRARDDSGAAAVEFALVLPLLTLLLFGIVEFGRAWNVKQVLTDAAREGARVAVVNNTLAAAAVTAMTRTAVTNAASRAGLATDGASLVITLTNVPGAVNTPATVAVLYNYRPLFGTWILRSGTVPLRSTFQMRNE